jgi:hypothetical protein
MIGAASAVYDSCTASIVSPRGVPRPDAPPCYTDPKVVSAFAFPFSPEHNTCPHPCTHSAPLYTLIMNRPFFSNPALWGSLLLTVATLLVSNNATSPHWLRILLWIGLTLYNGVWWLLQVPDYPAVQKDAPSPEVHREHVRLKRSIFTSRLISAFMLAFMSGALLLIFNADPDGAGARSLGIYGGILFIALVLGVFAEWRRYQASRPEP